MTNVNMEHKKKYPRTYHLPWSQTVASDDKRLLSTDCFSGKEVQISIKKDGESTAMYSDYHAVMTIAMPAVTPETAIISVTFAG